MKLMRQTTAADFEDIAAQVSARKPIESMSPVYQATRVGQKRTAAEIARSLDDSESSLYRDKRVADQPGITSYLAIAEVAERVTRAIARQPEPKMEITDEFQADSRQMVAFYLGEERAVEFEARLNAAKRAAKHGVPAMPWQKQMGDDAMRLLSEAYAEYVRTREPTVVEEEENAVELIEKYLGHDEAVRYTRTDDKAEGLKVVQAALDEALRHRDAHAEQVGRMQEQIGSLQDAYRRSLDPLADFRRDEARALCALDGLLTGGQS